MIHVIYNFQRQLLRTTLTFFAPTYSLSKRGYPGNPLKPPSGGPKFPQSVSKKILPKTGASSKLCHKPSSSNNQHPNTKPKSNGGKDPMSYMKSKQPKNLVANVKNNDNPPPTTVAQISKMSPKDICSMEQDNKKTLTDKLSTPTQTYNKNNSSTTNTQTNFNDPKIELPSSQIIQGDKITPPPNNLGLNVETPLNVVAAFTNAALTSAVLPSVNNTTSELVPLTQDSSIIETLTKTLDADNNTTPPSLDPNSATKVPLDTKAELRKRGLSEKCEKVNGVYIKTEEEGSIFIGESEGTDKFTKKGQGYLDSEFKDDNFITDPTIPRLKQLCFANMKIIMARHYEDIFMITSKLKHMLVVSDDKGEFFYVLNPLTSAKKGMCFEIGKQQFKQFQDEQHGKILSEQDKSNSYNKTRQLMQMHHIEVIRKKDVLVACDGNAYLNTLDDKIKLRIINEFKESNENDYKWFNIKGITEEQCKQIIEKHDYNVAHNIKHPLSLHEQEMNQQAALAQKEKQLIDKAQKDKENQDKYALYKKK